MKKTTFPDESEVEKKVEKPTFLCSPNTLNVCVRGCSFHRFLLLQLRGRFLKEKKMLMIT